MSSSLILAILFALTVLAYPLGYRRAAALARDRASDLRLHSQPHYYGLYTAAWTGLPALLLLVLWWIAEAPLITFLVLADLPPDMQALPANQLNLVLNEIQNLAQANGWSQSSQPALQAAAAHYQQLYQIAKLSLFTLMLSLASMGGLLAWRQISLTLRARNQVETLVRIAMIICAILAIFTTLGILLSVLFESIRFFHQVSFQEFLFGVEWSPQTALREDQAGSSGSFGALPLFAGTFLISAIALLVAVPVGLLSALYLSEYASKRVRTIAKPALEILAGIPTVVYGFFAALVIAPAIRDLGTSLGLSVASESALAAGLVMGMMIIPFVSSLSDDVINAVPQALRDASHALGATTAETFKRVIFPAALPGIIGGILLAASRAIGETMIVVMAAGLSAKLTANPLEAVTTVTVQMVTLLTGDQEFDSAKTLAAFALGLVLFVVTLLLNGVALYVVRKYREQYE